ncbi:hypothetical protein RJ640_006592 [Escallonia rubra]|uniref:Uncharacterized protein n=1 Tax=Escallonia rubra TaxID=112253 RepID=A0AA88U8F7_9ASTE|nr:hypothetical protein RJ640_006592 [Escallonia rubra]
MEFSLSSKRISLVLVLFLFEPRLCYGARKLASLYEPPPMTLKYHKGALLEGKVPLSILWYGKFSSAQKSIVVDFLLSLKPLEQKKLLSSSTTPLVSKWWETIETYMKKAGKNMTQFILTDQVTDETCSIGRTLKRPQISELAHRVISKPGGLTLVLTADDVGVEGFCMSNCGFHGSDSKAKSVFIWVGNSVTQCPGQCAWPFHQPIYGPQGAPLGAPNGDVGVEGMVVNIASLLAATVTNPFGNGYFQGPAEAPLEAASACPGVYGKGAYPGYAGELLIDATTRASYNAIGSNGRKYLLPALFDPNTSQCTTVV